MKTLKGTFLFLSVFAVTALASESDTLRVTVPFAFTAGSATLPAGEYLISQQDSQILTIGGKGGSAILMTMPQGQSADLRKSNVTFGRTAKGNMLIEVQMSGRPSVIMHAGK